jgi:16S rRNA processing protein RimM
VGERVCVARIGAAHGTRGEVRLWSFTAEPLAIAGYGPLETEDRAQRFEITALRPAKDHLVARLTGVDDRDAAERLTNLDLYVARERLPPPEPDEFYHADLIGLAVVDVNGAPIGEVVAVQNFGAGDLLEIRPAGEAQTVMLRFNEATVPQVDVAGGRIAIAPPEGLFKASSS